MKQPKTPDRTKEMFLKRQAIQVAGILPDDPHEAIRVLGYAQEIIETTFGLKQERAGAFRMDDLSVRLVSLRRPRHSRGSGDGAG